MPNPIRLVVADDHALFRQGLSFLLGLEPDVAIVGEVHRVADLPDLLARTPCDELLLDLQMEHSTLIDIESLAAKVPVVVLTASELPSDAVAAIRNGAMAVVFKRFAVETLMDAIRTVAAGNVWLPPDLQTHVAAHLREPAANQLSLREAEVVRYVAMGLRNAEVARQLSISEETVKGHLKRIFRKVGVRDRVELVRYAARTGLA
ncbi:MAG TPA: response regulator transcription factor [Candidatus Binatia bacterium]|nr:response regulator transcription factor [Candidatus Binatia bacterium]